MFSWSHSSTCVGIIMNLHHSLFQLQGRSLTSVCDLEAYARDWKLMANWTGVLCLLQLRTSIRRVQFILQMFILQCGYFLRYFPKKNRDLVWSSSNAWPAQTGTGLSALEILCDKSPGRLHWKGPRDNKTLTSTYWKVNLIWTSHFS